MTEHENRLQEAAEVMDNIKGYFWLEDNTRLCPHPSVIRRFGQGGICRVAAYTCLSCRYAVRFPYFGGTRCGYGQNGGKNGTEAAAGNAPDGAESRSGRDTAPPAPGSRGKRGRPGESEQPEFCGDLLQIQETEGGGNNANC